MFKPGYIFEKIIYRLLLVSGWKRDVVQANLNFVHSNPSKVIYTKEYRQIISNLSRHVSEILFDFGSFKRLPLDFSSYPFKQNLITYKLADGSEPVLDKMRKGGIFLTAHYGNYEAMGPWLCRLGIPLVASYIPVKPKWLIYILERKIRSVDGRSYSVDARTPRDFLRILNDGKLFCLLADQDSRIPSAIDGTLLGQPANINPLPDFLLKHRPQTPVFICWMEELGASPKETSTKCASLKKVRVLHAIEVVGAQSKIVSSTESCVVNSQFNKWLELRIAENPNLWYSWTHRRFYSREPGIY